ncbi:MAG TPA: hypothetical protein VD738_04405, partial [Nitrospira sp.]|nr:hypothetical protein [Nitrospira sp.]
SPEEDRSANAQQASVHRVLDVIVRSSECELEELILKCDGLTWNQVFLAIDRLSRSGDVQLTLKRPGVYVLSAPKLMKALGMHR